MKDGREGKSRLVVQRPTRVPKPFPAIDLRSAQYYKAQTLFEECFVVRGPTIRQIF